MPSGLLQRSRLMRPSRFTAARRDRDFLSGLAGVETKSSAIRAVRGPRSFSSTTPTIWSQDPEFLVNHSGEAAKGD